VPANSSFCIPILPTAMRTPQPEPAEANLRSTKSSLENVPCKCKMKTLQHPAHDGLIVKALRIEIQDS